MISTKALVEKANAWQTVLPYLKKKAHAVVKLLPHERIIQIDLSGTNPDLAQLDVVDTAAIEAYIQQELVKNRAVGAIGGYMENRALYLRSTVFAGAEHRTLHLAILGFISQGSYFFSRFYSLAVIQALQ